MKPALVAVIALFASVSNVSAYSKQNAHDEDAASVVFAEEPHYSPHSWVIEKSIEFPAQQGFQTEANLARKYKLPMREGVAFNDVWGDADLAGGSVLDYYSPGAANTGYGFGCALDDIFFAPLRAWARRWLVGDRSTVAG